MTNGVDRPTSREWVGRFRLFLAMLGVGLLVALLVPPVSAILLRYEFGESLQFAVFAFAVPALLVSSAPWRRVGLASSELHVLSDDGASVSPIEPRWIDRIVMSRSRATHQRRTILYAFTYGFLVVFWRVAPIVDYLVRHRWLVIVEALTLVALGIPLFTRLIESPPLQPGTLRPYRIGISAGVMWIAWVVAYLDGMSHDSWYNVFQHFAGRGISKAADQQLSAGVIWMVSAAVFVPIIYWNLIHWLQSEEDPNDELQRMVRDERTRGFFGVD